MNHKKGFKKINKPTDQRLSLIKNLTFNLIKNGQIKTTSLRAKQTQSYVEKLITIAKGDTDLNKIRLVHKEINNKSFITNLFKVAKKYKTFNGGYTSIIKCGLRKGDSAELSIIKLI